MCSSIFVEKLRWHLMKLNFLCRRIQFHCNCIRIGCRTNYNKVCEIVLPTEQIYNDLLRNCEVILTIPSANQCHIFLWHDTYYTRKFIYSSKTYYVRPNHLDCVNFLFGNFDKYLNFDFNQIKGKLKKDDIPLVSTMWERWKSAKKKKEAIIKCQLVWIYMKNLKMEIRQKLYGETKCMDCYYNENCDQSPTHQRKRDFLFLFFWLNDITAITSDLCIYKQKRMNYAYLYN